MLIFTTGSFWAIEAVAISRKDSNNVTFFILLLISVVLRIFDLFGSKIFLDTRPRPSKQKTFQMNTFLNRLGFLSVAMMMLVAISSCNTDKTSHAVITVLKEQAPTTGLQPVPVEGATVRLYVDVPSDFQDVFLTTDAAGKVNFDYEFPATLLVDVEYQGEVDTRNGLPMEAGETTSITIVLPE